MLLADLLYLSSPHTVRKADNKLSAYLNAHLHALFGECKDQQRWSAVVRANHRPNIDYNTNSMC